MKPRRVPVPETRRVLLATPVFDTYWKFACERQRIFHQRVNGQPPPWTDDTVLSNHRFTNAYRASDRVSQYLIRHVIYGGPASAEDVVFRTFLFKVFNKIETWKLLEDAFGQISWTSFDVRLAERVLDEAMHNGQRIYSAAYIMPSPKFGADRKHVNHLRLLAHMMDTELPAQIAQSKSLGDLYRLLRGYPSIGAFLAFQLAIDINYSTITNFSEMDFVIAGPGAKSGISKCFTDTAGLSDEEVIQVVAELAPEEFARQGLAFKDLWGRQLQLIDCQNLFCETDKYARVMHPDVLGRSGRAKIKQRFSARPRPTPQWYPPKWGVRPPAPRDTNTSHPGQGELAFAMAVVAT